MNEYMNMWRNYANFSDRTSLKGYWMAVLVNFFVVLFLGWVTRPLHLSLLAWLYGVAVIVPRLSLTIRRLRDAGKPWYFLLLNLIPVVGTLILAVILCLPSRHSETVPVV